MEELDQWIVRMGSFTWEIGPGIKTGKRFVLSPGGDSLLLLQTEKIISYAPKIEGWEFYAAKPAKEWNLIFNYYIKSGEEVKIDASSWEYALLRYNDGMFDILIKYSGLPNLNREDLQTIAEILIDGILGERARIIHIAQVEMLSVLEEKYAKNTSRLKYLRDHLDGLRII